jgi:UDP-N-acetylglucosamine--N-acetylmuramyl-(pentapeptide) pyrophosphoryl-undecaprenol N-acetylglucosamine transferase
MEYRKLRIMISGGGTGGHIFPAISIAGALKKLNPENEILFVGAEGKMEMEKVPAAGYKIVALPIVGLQRRPTWHNFVNDIQVPFKVMASVRKAGRLIKEFKPDIAIGVGGYASAPLLWEAQKKGVTTMIQEQNGFAGLANKILGKKAGKICVAYDGMERFFPADKIVKTGNPIRAEVSHPATPEQKAEAMKFYGLDPQKKHIFIVGGSLGSLTLNKSMERWISEGCKGGEGVEIIWQYGRYYKSGVDSFMEDAKAKGLGGETLAYIHHSDFIKRMDLAYAAADIVISRSGASSISEICALGKAAIFVPSPNVAEDHQTHNAMALVNKGAAMIVKDADAPEKLLPTALDVLGKPEEIQKMEKNAAALGLPDAAETIAKEAYKLLEEKNDGQVR